MHFGDYFAAGRGYILSSEPKFSIDLLAVCLIGVAALVLFHVYDVIHFPCEIDRTVFT